MTARVTQHPFPATIGERSKLAQTIRNELATYKRINGPYGTTERDACIARIDRAWQRLLHLEGWSP